MSEKQPDAPAFQLPTEEKIACLIELVGDELERIAIAEEDMQLPLTIASGILARAAAIRGKDEAADSGLKAEAPPP